MLQHLVILELVNELTYGWGHLATERSCGDYRWFHFEKLRIEWSVASSGVVLYIGCKYEEPGTGDPPVTLYCWRASCSEGVSLPPLRNEKPVEGSWVVRDLIVALLQRQLKARAEVEQAQTALQARSEAYCQGLLTELQGGQVEHS